MDDHDADSTSPTGTPREFVGYRGEVARYRRRPGGWWLLALVGVPLVLALIGGAISPSSLPLSQARAAAVRDGLVAAGVTNTMTATGFGSANPVGDNTTDAGLAANRRVEIVIS